MYVSGGRAEYHFENIFIILSDVYEVYTGKCEQGQDMVRFSLRGNNLLVKG
jgi:hypothetical protein